jgi:hypothetical protein
VKQLKQHCRLRGINSKRLPAIQVSSAKHGCVNWRPDMTIQRKAGLHLVLIVAAALGCSVSVMSGTVAAIQYSAAPAVSAQA